MIKSLTDSVAELRLRQILTPILPQLEQVEQKLQLISLECEGLLKESSAYVLASGGKRLRAALVLFCYSLGKKKTDWSSAINLAAAVEMIHAATLVHDDVLDRSALRRARPTVNARYGEEVAILLGDFLYTRAFPLIVELGVPEILVWVTQSTQEVCDGEMSQLKNRYKIDLSLPEYLEFIRKKTASLIAVSAKGGAHLGGLSVEQVQALSNFGQDIGITFQIVDDLLDVIGTEKKLGKPAHNDMSNGKMTLPMILFLQAATAREKDQFKQLFESANADWGSLQKLLNKYDIANQTDARAAEFFERAQNQLNSFEESTRDSLISLSRFVLKRNY